MISVFHGPDAATHDAFQSWREAHSDGFDMTEKTTEVHADGQCIDCRCGPCPGMQLAPAGDGVVQDEANQRIDMSARQHDLVQQRAEGLQIVKRVRLR